MDPAELPLRDIHLPDPVGWWPPAPGWWILAAILLLSAVLLIRQWRQRRTVAYRFRRELLRLRADYARDHDTERLIQRGSVLLRRACLSAFPRDQVAGLSGSGWTRFIGKLLGQDAAASEYGQLLVEAPYRRGIAVDADWYLDLLARVASRLDVKLESE